MIEKVLKDNEILKRARKKLRLTQQELADYLGTQREIISYWEIGQRPIPKEFLKEIKKLKAKKDLLHSSKLTNIGVYTHRNSNLLHSPQEKNTKNRDSVTFLKKFLPLLENDAFLSPKYSMEKHILDAYITFKKDSKKNGKCFPVVTDFINGEFKEFNKKEVLKYFGSLSNAKKLAGKLERYLAKKRREDKIIRTFPLPSGEIKILEGDRGFGCPCCGKKWKGVNQFYSALREFINKEIDDSTSSADSADANTDAIQRLKAVLFDTPKCFCGGDIKPEFKSSFKSIVLSRLNKINPNDNCREAIFGKGMER